MIKHLAVRTTILLLVVLTTACGSEPALRADDGNGFGAITGVRVERFSVSPDQRSIAVIGTRGHEPYQLLVRHAGDTVRVDAGDRWVVDAAWSPDGKSLLLATTTSDADAPDPRFEVLSLDTLERRTIPVSQPLFGGAGMTFVTASTAVVSASVGEESSMRDLWVLDVQTGQVRQLTSTPDLIEDNPMAVNETSVLASRGPETSSAGPNGTLAVIDIATGTGREVTSDGLTVEAAGGIHGNEAVFSGFRGNRRDQRAIWAVGLESGRLRKANIDGMHPTFIDDGSTILYIDVKERSLRTVPFDKLQPAA